MEESGLMPSLRPLRFLPSRGWLIVLLPWLAALLFTPLAFGGVTPGLRAISDGLLVLSFLAWIVLLGVEKRLPKISPWCRGAMVFLLVWSGIHWLNPKSIHYEVFWIFSHLDHISWLPGTSDKAATGKILVHWLSLAAGFLVLLDGCRQAKVRWLLLGGLALTGVLIALIGIYQKASGTEKILWIAKEYPPRYFFAAFVYHGHAAAFLNLCWPAALAIVLRARDCEKSGLIISLWITALFLTVAALFVNTSKAGHALGAVGLILALIRFRSHFFSGQTSKLVMILTSILVLGAIAVMVIPALSISMTRWSSFWTGISTQGRLQAYGFCLKMLPDAGFFGFGPGTFHLSFPMYRAEGGDEAMRGRWTHAHQDYLQMVIEWGYIAAAAWFILIGGAVLRGFRSVRQNLKKGRVEYSPSCALIALFLVLTHAMSDFPLQIPAIQYAIAVYLGILWNAGLRSP